MKISIVFLFFFPFLLLSRWKLQVWHVATFVGNWQFYRITLQLNSSIVAAWYWRPDVTEALQPANPLAAEYFETLS